MYVPIHSKECKWQSRARQVRDVMISKIGDRQGRGSEAYSGRGLVSVQCQYSVSIVEVQIKLL
jgi:hypothetical protein